MINGSDPAFPLPKGADNIPPEVAGLTKREEFAKAAMQGIIGKLIYKGSNLTGTAEDAVAYADALIAELSKEVKA